MKKQQLGPISGFLKAGGATIHKAKDPLAIRSGPSDVRVNTNPKTSYQFSRTPFGIPVSEVESGAVVVNQDMAAIDRIIQELVMAKTGRSPMQKAAPKFKVGDRIRLAEHPMYGDKIFTITKTVGGSYEYSDGKGLSGSGLGYSFELV
jgi:hypothetical protein